jgi:carbonic anhydrase/acetyltransferase-like protein (isoleucine patch superfamily)
MPIIDSKGGYQVVHDKNKTLCFIGNTHYNKLLYSYFSKIRDCVSLSLEDVDQKSQEWLSQHQFMCVASTSKFKYQVSNTLNQYGIDYFSVISDCCFVGNNVNIGYNVLVNHFTSVWDNCDIKDHTTITNNCDLAHGTTISECCHISPFSMLSFAKVNSGVFVGARSFVFGHPDNPIEIDDFVYVTADSRVIKSISDAGTYYSNRKINSKISLDY